MTDGLDPRARARVGSVLDEKWTLESLLGTGGMGAVYAAKHRNGARAAVKILHPDLASIDEVRERFLREGYAANKVEHRGVVQVLDDDVVTEGLDAGSAYLVMELLEGESLQDRAIRTPKLSEVELLEVMDAVLDVLAAAHEHGVVHRDLKPENIFLARDPEREGVRVKVLDFGLARIAEAASVTTVGMAVGTPSFMSPEQASGRNDEIDGKTDVFALGATIFRILTGRRIHNADNMVQLVMLMASDPAPPLRTVQPDASEALAGVVDRALFFEKDERPTAASLQVVVRQALRILFERDEPRDPNAPPRLRIIPSSARNVRAAGPQDDINSTNVIAAPASDPVIARPIARRVVTSTTLPWVLVLVLLAIVGWTALPSVGSVLERHATVAPPPSSAPPIGAPATTTTSVTPVTDEHVELPAEPIEEDASYEELGVVDAAASSVHIELPPPVVAASKPAAPGPGPTTTKKPASQLPWVKKRQQKH